jgi:transposase
MRTKTILNRVEKFNSSVYGEGRFEEGADGPALVVRIVPRNNSRVFCSGCGRPGLVYDRVRERRFESVTLWRISVFLAYWMQRVNCKRCG